MEFFLIKTTGPNFLHRNININITYLFKVYFFDTEFPYISRNFYFIRLRRSGVNICNIYISYMWYIWQRFYFDGSAILALIS